MQPQDSSRMFNQRAHVWQGINYDMLREIYSWNMPYEMSNGLVTRRSRSLSAMLYGTHVCQHWRNVLLDSPLLWAQCIDLSALEHRPIEWLETVLYRSKKSPLTLTGDLISAWGPTDVSWTFLTLLRTHWERIRDVSVYVQIMAEFDGVQWIEEMLELLSRPTKSMRHFSIDIQFRDDPEEVFSNISPFNQDAPALRSLSLSMPSQDFPITITAPLHNLRTLCMPTWSEHATDVELLTMCMQMPMLERLTLALETVSTSDTRLRPQLPHLIFIDIKSRGLEIYPAFLGRINPNSACALQLMNLKCLDWQSFQLDIAIDKADGALRVLRRYLDLLFSHKHEELPELRIRVTSKRILVTSSAPYPVEIHWEVPQRGNQPFLIRLFERVFTHLSLVTYPRHISQLDLYHDLQFSILPDVSCLLGLLNSMSTVTTLAINIHCLLYIERLVINSNMLPCLETLILHGDGRVATTIPFLMHRNRTIPIRRLDLTGSDQGVIDHACALLDMICGLELVWFPDMPGRKETYICGSGGVRYAKRTPYYVTHTV